MALPKFSFSGWTSQSLAPKVNPAAVATPATIPFSSAADIRKNAMAGGFSPVPPKAALDRIKASPGGIAAWSASIMAGKDPQIGTSTDPINVVTPANMTGDVIDMGQGGPGTLVGTTNAANPDLPAWLQSEVDRLNAQDALRKSMAGSVTGGAAPNQNVGDILQGVAAVTAARGQFNTSLNQINEQARLQSLIQQRNQLRPVGGFGFNNPMDVNRQIGLDREISGYQNVNLPLAAGAVGGFRPSGWVNPFRTF